jgi:hypothetical protein
MSQWGHYPALRVDRIMSGLAPKRGHRLRISRLELISVLLRGHACTRGNWETVLGRRVLVLDDGRVLSRPHLRALGALHYATSSAGKISSVVIASTGICSIDSKRTEHFGQCQR